MELKKHYTNEQTGINYTLHGDFYLPDIKLLKKISASANGECYTNLILKSTTKHFFNALLIKGNLFQHCAEIDK